ncbi:ribonuclease [Mesotoga sp. Brook.08.YT.4.2.5.1]|jgi:ribonuclease Y|uniref:ribonuclease Y n=1 Tax=unclassified Mesotoga TaxID=1184398 RepID=UPI000B0B6759|nr:MULTISPECIES: ribonuclease Y [unclassified Mesotoga]PNE22682.1 ribonuclease [Mesotoga sp. Brook.08.YT.4.2.5.1]RAM58987.1 ribonuclease [Mesotoga sp. SC_4PWL113PWK15]RIZ61619.1 ribonuclease [Mesotoga sp. SC_NapDC2]PVD17724.1 ribonuclease [Mesotoga sp. Brook.08.105.5.1]RDI94189.1 ribonuclease [Mesotoga sp. Brook.08.YT.4.2.5.2.]
MMLLIGIIAGLAAGIALAYFILTPLAVKKAKDELELQLKSAKQDSESIIKRAQEEADHLKKKALLEGREELHRLREEQEKDFKRDREELKQWEERISRREDNIDKKEEAIERTRQQLDIERARVEEMKEEAEKKLFSLADLSMEDAREIVLRRAEEIYEHDLAQKLKEMKDHYDEEGNRYAKWVIVNSVQRYAADYTGDITVSAVSLPSDEMKGRIIGREGRNIRAFEKLTGSDLVIDDTPEVVVVSCFNPLRRAIAKMTLDRLVEDGRIHPARIEEMYEKSKKEIYSEIKEAGQEALMKVGIPSMHPELVKLLGRLKFRTSYGQNVLQHSVEVAHLAALMASELGLNIDKAKRGAILHDIGKAIDHEVEGSHAIIGGEIAKRYGEKVQVVNMIQYHHGETEALTPEAVLVAAADAVSASRPGARRESLDMYIKRLENLENIATGFKHIEKAYAIQAGREIRVIVEPEKVDDLLAEKMAVDIAKKIEEELEYPGVIKVTVIRERRSVSYAS